MADYVNEEKSRTGQEISYNVQLDTPQIYLYAARI
jgi:hypothetical protein